MKFTIIALALAAAVGAQTWDKVPECAQGCILDAVADKTKCGTTDYGCICDYRDIVEKRATKCVIKKCGKNVARHKVIPAVDALCIAYGTPNS
ncbi:hypothetical protein GGR50DRAFT_527078 [Xylaria sp. CBS 124048]|nr:hypothetical protein GGR50DRAFT_527078 [Xylaria sp. CBS 124048]